MLSPSKTINNTYSINIIRVIDDGHATLHISDIGPSQAFLVASAHRPMSSKKGATVLYREMVKTLCARRLSIVQEKIFASVSQQRSILDARKKVFDANGLDAEGPLTYIEGRPVWGQGLAGIVIHAVRAEVKEEEPRTIYYRQKPCGRGWRKDGISHLMLQNLKGQPTEAHTDRVDRPQQVTALFQSAEEILEEQGALYSDVVRTWFYLEKIIDWYDDFNRIRNSVYRRFGIMPTESEKRLKLPASTGIEGINPQNAAAVLDLFAISSPRNQPPCCEQLTSVGQMDAFRYGSAFSRGALIRDSDCAYISLSGTAAIDEKGASLFIDDPEKQIACTFDKARILLAGRSAVLSNAAVAVAYIKHANQVDFFWKIAAEYGLGNLPVICVVADICRHELLFELECIVAID